MKKPVRPRVPRSQSAPSSRRVTPPRGQERREPHRESGKPASQRVEVEQPEDGQQFSDSVSASKQDHSGGSEVSRSSWATGLGAWWKQVRGGDKPTQDPNGKETEEETISAVTAETVVLDTSVEASASVEVSPSAVSGPVAVHVEDTEGGGDVPVSVRQSGRAFTRVFASHSSRSEESESPIELGERIAERKNAQRRRRWYQWGMLASVVLLVIAAVWVVFFSSLLALRSDGVQVEGTSSDQHREAVIASAQPYVGVPLARIDTGQWEKTVQQIPWVRTAEVAVSLPTEATIKITERVPVALVSHAGVSVLVDSDATQLTYLETKDADYPRVEVTAEQKDFQRAVLAALAVITALPPEIKEQVRSYTVSSPSNVQFTLRSGAVVKWGSREDSNFKARVLQTLWKRPARVYDLTTPTSPVTS